MAKIPTFFSFGAYCGTDRTDSEASNASSNEPLDRRRAACNPRAPTAAPMASALMLLLLLLEDMTNTFEYRSGEYALVLVDRDVKVKLVER